MKKIIFISALLAIAWQFIFAENDTNGRIIYPFLDISTSARTAALADSVCGLSGDPGDDFANPALLAAVKSPQLSLTYGKWFIDSSYQSLSAASDFGFGCIGAQVLYLNLGEFEQRNDLGQLQDGKLRSFNIDASAAYAMKPVPRLSAGVALKVIGQFAAYTSKASVAMDLGAQYQFEKVSVGFAINNIGVDPKYGFPLTIRSGAYSVVDISTEHKIAMGFDAKYVLSDELTLSAGAEYSYAGTVFARLGYKIRSGSYQYDVITGFTTGIGVKAGGFEFDYALVPFGDLGITHRATVSYVFGKIEDRHTEKKAAQKPAVPVKTEPKDIKPMKKLAREYATMGNIGLALLKVEEALRISPQDKELIKMKADYMKINRSGPDGKKIN